MNLFIFNFKSFLITFVFTSCLGFLGTIFLIEFHLRKENRLEKDYNYNFLNSKGRYLAFGDSRVESSLVSGFEVDNLGQPSDNLNIIYDKIIYKINNNKQGIKGIILQADPHLFSFYRLVSKKKFALGKNDTLLSNFYFLRPSNRAYILDLSKVVWMKLLYSNKKTNIIKSTTNYSTEYVLKRIQLQNPIKNFTNTDFLKKYESIINILQQRSIKICLISFPTSSLYRKYLSNFPNYEIVINYFKKMSKNKSIKYLDFRATMKDKSFKDPDHLKRDLNFTKNVLNRCGFE